MQMLIRRQSHAHARAQARTLRFLIWVARGVCFGGEKTSQHRSCMPLRSVAIADEENIEIHVRDLDLFC